MVIGHFITAYAQSVRDTLEGKASPLQAWTGQARPGQEDKALKISRHSAHEGGKVISTTQQPPLPPRDIPSLHFC